ncbi:MAG: Ig-like domain-containing protein [Oscillospiraceae bacterium]|nr:Ig-like domain-containing protein [Oscillospiraceae bacterium]
MKRIRPAQSTAVYIIWYPGAWYGPGLGQRRTMSLTQATTTLYAIWDIPVERIEITPQRIVLYPGQLYRPQVEIFPANATNQTLSWRTGNKSTVVSVSASGLITANRVGGLGLYYWN